MGTAKHKTAAAARCCPLHSTVHTVSLLVCCFITIIFCYPTHSNKTLENSSSPQTRAHVVRQTHSSAARICSLDRVVFCKILSIAYTHTHVCGKASRAAVNQQENQALMGEHFDCSRFMTHNLCVAIKQTGMTGSLNAEPNQTDCKRGCVCVRERECEKERATPTVPR